MEVEHPSMLTRIDGSNLLFSMPYRTQTMRQICSPRWRKPGWSSITRNVCDKRRVPSIGQLWRKSGIVQSWLPFCDHFRPIKHQPTERPSDSLQEHAREIWFLRTWIPFDEFRFQEVANDFQLRSDISRVLEPHCNFIEQLKIFHWPSFKTEYTRR